MWYVYIIRSINLPDQEYTGASEDLKQRVKAHNSGKSTHTSKFVPRELVWYCAFPDKYKPLEFEKYLKSHSGSAGAPGVVPGYQAFFVGFATPINTFISPLPCSLMNEKGCVTAQDAKPDAANAASTLSFVRP